MRFSLPLATSMALRACIALALSAVLCSCPWTPPGPEQNGTAVIPGASWIYAAGGWTGPGEASATVYRVPLRADGSLGAWQETTPLPAPVAEAAGIVIGSFIHVYGGLDATEYLAPIDAEGRIGFLNIVDGKEVRTWGKGFRELPEARSGGRIVFAEGRMEWIGGSRADGSPAPRWTARQWKDGQTGYWYRWEECPFPDSGEVADRGARLPRGQWLPAAGWFSKRQPIRLEASLGPQALLPRVWPTAGFLRTATPTSTTAASPLLTLLNPGDSLRFTRAQGSEPADPTEASPLYDSANPPYALDGEIFRWRSFRADAQASAVLRTVYSLRGPNSFPMLKAILSPEEASSPLEEISLTERYSDGSTADVPSIWFRLDIDADMGVRLSWTDLNDQPADGTASAPVRLSLVEGDLYLPAWDKTGADILRKTGGWTSPVEAFLPKGSYYLWIERSDGASGGTMSLGVEELDLISL